MIFQLVPSTTLDHKYDIRPVAPEAQHSPLIARMEDRKSISPPKTALMHRHSVPLFLAAGFLLTASITLGAQSTDPAPPQAPAAPAAPAAASSGAMGSDSTPYVLTNLVLPAKAKPAQGPALLAAEFKKAADLKKTPVVYVYSPKSSPLEEFHKLFADSLVKDAFRGVYLIEVDVNTWRPFLKQSNITVTGVPAYYAIGEDGKSIGRQIAAATWGDDTPATMSKPLKSFFQSLAPGRTNVYIPPSNDNGQSMPGMPGGMGGGMPRF